MKRRLHTYILVVICVMFAIISAYQCLTVPFESDEKLQHGHTIGYESNGCLYYSVVGLISSAWDGYRYDYRNRLLSWGLGIAAIPLLFWVGRSTKDSFTGLLAAFLLASNVAHLAAASYHRFYTANECCAILATGLCLWACRGESWSRWMWYLLAMLAVVASMMLSLLLLLIHLVIVLLTSPQRSVALKRFAWAALMCCLLWGFMVFTDRTGLNRVQYGEFNKLSLVTVSDMLLSHGENHRSYISESLDLNTFVAPVKRTGNGFLQILKWLTLLAGIGVWRFSRSAAWKKLTRVKLALFIGVACIIVLLIAFSYSVKNLIKPANLFWLIPYVVLILGMAMRISRVFRIAMLTAVLLASPYLSLMTTMGGFNNVYVRYAFSNRKQGELIVVDHMSTVSLPTVLSSVLDVPHFRHNVPGVLIISDTRSDMLRFLLCTAPTRWKRIWFLTSRRQELERYLGNGHPVTIGNNTVRYLMCSPVKTYEFKLLLYYIIIEPSDAGEGKELRSQSQG